MTTTKRGGEKCTHLHEVPLTSQASVLALLPTCTRCTPSASAMRDLGMLPATRARRWWWWRVSPLRRTRRSSKCRRQLRAKPAATRTKKGQKHLRSAAPTTIATASTFLCVAGLASYTAQCTNGIGKRVASARTTHRPLVLHSCVAMFINVIFVILPRGDNMVPMVHVYSCARVLASTRVLEYRYSYF